ncbi:methylated-DNA--[protein]-cysteine S-methyltransferase [Georgenia sp. EYE_87]|uniref:methylated-DNA--[protein]-cysteine S-methyltransferase n=1 Tax=Georgenia sp. EYE_87 TaxID=2853448 RepID=UPI002005FC01|nr:methylated-DNA--[protein]-cysteine S-methyltransferase [Georgenia sp. EYE_87]MCK6209533.1 methylated-DNA--[protein]-cysteine S-methyltransferase [Georgenia sp. EYE_87]
MTTTEPTTEPGADVLTGLHDVLPENVARLHARLVARAAEQDLLDVAVRTLDSPVGELLLAATPAGLLRIAFDVEGHDAVLDRLARTVSPRILHAPGRLDVVAHELDEYFAGRRRSFDVPLDLRLTAGFRREVLDHLADVGYGRTVTYTELAAASGRPRAVRAAASACATNPVPLVVPCHRVLRADGTLGGYLGGLDAKRTLLELERAA